MRISVGAGTYVVGVSGGVDSMVLLDLMRKRPGVKVIVAHYDHGIRPDSVQDRKLVQDIALAHNLPFVHENGNLGSKASEAVARTARYEFLERVKQVSNAKAIAVAHHQDDVLETAVMNMLRGSGRRGLTSLKSHPELIRPLLAYEKQDMYDYADKHGLSWREDSSNTDVTYRRNYIRYKVLPKLTPGQRAQFVILLEQLRDLNKAIDTGLDTLLHAQPALDKIDRNWFISLPHGVAREMTHAWLRRHKVRDVTSKTIERVVTAMKTKRIGQKIDLDDNHVIQIHKSYLALVPRDR